MDLKNLPEFFRHLLREGRIAPADILQTQDGFRLLRKSLCDLLAESGVTYLTDAAGLDLPCSRFFDDWFVYAVADGQTHTYSLVKFREQEHDAQDGCSADGDTPGVTVCFIAFACEKLLCCLRDPTVENRQLLEQQIDRVVARKGQRHDPALKRYFLAPGSQGAYLVAAAYIRHISLFARDGQLEVPEHYKKMARQLSEKSARVPDFIEELNRKAGAVVCDHETIFIKDREDPTIFEAAAILATHTGNTSVYSFAAEVEYHARFLTPWARCKLPFLGRSLYDSAIRADMSIGDGEFQGPAPFYRADSRIVKRQYRLHHPSSLSLPLRK